MCKHGRAEVSVTNWLRSCGAAVKDTDAASRQETGRRLNNRAEKLHLPFRRRDRAMFRFQPMGTLQKFAAVHASVDTHINHERSLSSRDNFKLRRIVALIERRSLRGIGADRIAVQLNRISVRFRTFS